MQNDRSSRRDYAAQARAEALQTLYRIAGLVLLALTLLGVLWLAGHVHPDFATAVAPAASGSASAPSASAALTPSVA